MTQLYFSFEAEMLSIPLERGKVPVCKECKKPLQNFPGYLSELNTLYCSDCYPAGGCHHWPDVPSDPNDVMAVLLTTVNPA